MKRIRLAVFGLSVTIAAAIRCSHQQPPAQKAEVKPQLFDTGSFLHEQHLNLTNTKLECDSCHVADEKAGFALQRPGSKQHAPCDDCHRQAFYEAPGKLCEVCHASVNPTVKGQSPLVPYPRRHERAQLISEFNHQLHLDATRLKLPDGARCSGCHRVANVEEAYASFPTHADCAPCHAAPGQGGTVSKPQMGHCRECHARNGPGRGRHFIKNDVRFTHGKHQQDQAKRRVECERCHYAVAGSTQSTELVLPAMSDCKKCHDNKDETPERVRMSDCGLCHTTDIESKPLPGNHTAMREILPSEGRRTVASGDEID
jgi:hypothetical protein